LPDHRLCQACREQGQNSGHSRAELEKRCQGQEETLADWDHIYVSKGCKQCRMSGYSGHLFVMQSLFLNEESRSLISRLHYPERQQQLKTKTRSLRSAALQLVKDGELSLAELLRVIPSGIH
jgi:type II secretory ATPase GspE/PulE/Tfp pilus assembly ATPase PilB-like protein